MSVTILFPDTEFSPLRLDMNSKLCESIDATNSPVLFGCRTGICGTCLVEVADENLESLPPPGENELELLSIVAPGNKNARLACQLSANIDLTLKYIG